MQEVEVGSIPISRLAEVLPPERVERLEQSAVRARADFGDRVIWHVNATAHGGGVAEMLQTLLAYGNGAGIENRWLVIDGDPEFFAITKRIHNKLHGSPGDGGDLGEREHAHYQAVLAENLAELVSRVSPGDLVMLHDPQTAGLREGLRDSGVQVTWRCHVGCDDTNEHTDLAWAFLRPYVEDVEAFVFSAAGLRADLGRRPAARRDPAVDRPFLGQERGARRRAGRGGDGQGRSGGRWRPGRAGALHATGRHGCSGP